MNKSGNDTRLTTINTGLTHTEREIINTLPSGLQIYTKAKDSPKISDLPPVDAEIMIYNLISETQINIGHTKSAEDENVNQITSASILNFINQKYKTLTVAELKLAFLNGLSGDYGDYIGVNLKSASQWIKGYLNDEKRKQAMSEWNKCLDNVKKHVYTDEQKEQIEIDGCLHYFNEFRQNKMLERFVMPTDYLCSIFYLRLKTLGLINDSTFSQDKKQQMFSEAKTEYEKGFNNRNISKDIYGAMLTMIAKKQNKPFDHLCKRIALHEYFKELVKNDCNLSDELEKIKIK
jgi:hypothetical protein